MNLFKTALLSSLLVAAVAAQAQTVTGYTDLHDFGGNTTLSNGTLGPDGANPQTSVVFDKFGNMYGTSQAGGAHSGAGMLWEITAAGVYKDLHDFGGTVTNADGQSGPDGSMPGAGVTVDGNGNLYGTTYQGGPNVSGGAPYGAGNIWEITAAGTYLDLHDFGGAITVANGQTGTDGIGSTCVITIGSNGALYGTTALGGANALGMVWVIESGAYKDIHDFGGTVLNVGGQSGPDGSVPASGVTFDTNGNMFGTTEYGGPSPITFGTNSGAGIVWEITAAGAYKDVHDFGLTVTNSGGNSGPDGVSPYWGVSFDAAGNMFGTTEYGGSSSGTSNVGMVWEITTGGVYKDLHDFGGSTILSDGTTTGDDGEIPEGGVLLDALGNLYGCTTAGGPNDVLYGGDGIVYEITAAGAYKDLHDFGGTITNADGASGPDGTYPGQIAFDAGGNLVGTAYLGGPIGGNGMTWRVSLLTITVTGLSLSPTTVVGGAGSTGTVTISNSAPVGGYAVLLSSSSQAATVPASVVVPVGTKTATFTVTTTGVSAATSVTITAGTGSKTATLTVNPAALSSVSVNPTSVAGGNSATGTVTLSGQAGGSGIAVTLTSASTLAKVPSSVTVASGASTATFTVNTSGVSTSTPVKITASIGSASQSTTLTLTPPALAHFSVSPNSVLGGASATGTVSLNGNAGSKGSVITLSSSATTATLPKSVTIASGQSQATFAVKTTAVPAVKTVTLTAKSGTVSLTATLTVNPPTLSSVSVSPTSVIGGSSAKGTVTLSSAAGSGGVPVKLASGSPATVPASVTVPSGKTSATFTVKTVAVGVQTSATITAILGQVSKTATLTVNPPSLKSVNVTPTTVKGGSTASGIVTLTSAAPKGGLSVSLKSSSSVATVSATVTVASGATTGKFTVKTSKVTASTPVTITATLGSVSKTAPMTVH